ncbi:hypothetical protein LCGC14_1027180 [marine sediment metagenome]|uniref:Uncharacterized protein n=1 Tax=marine sediment metagenome TaxID=412755 RepID=A0A0F9R1N4_9ZZZZ
MKKEIKILTQNTCYTTLLVNGKKHIIPTRELEEWVKYFSGSFLDKDKSELK